MHSMDNMDIDKIHKLHKYRDQIYLSGNTCFYLHFEVHDIQTQRFHNNAIKIYKLNNTKLDSFKIKPKRKSQITPQKKSSRKTKRTHAK